MDSVHGLGRFFNGYVITTRDVTAETGDNHYRAGDVERERATNLRSAQARYTVSDVNNTSPSRPVSFGSIHAFARAESCLG